MSIIVTSLIVASGVLLGRMLARSGRKEGGTVAGAPVGDAKTDAGAGPNEEKGSSEPPPRAEKPKAKADAGALLVDFPCKLGDVVMHTAGEEAWLAGVLLLSDRAPIAALFVAPEAGGDRAVLAHPAPTEEIVWLGPADAAALGLGAEPPASVEDGGDRFDRTRRLPVRVERLGSGAPDVGSTAIFAEYKSLSGERLVALCGSKPVAFRGMVLEPGMYSVLGGGGTDL